MSGFISGAGAKTPIENLYHSGKILKAMINNGTTRAIAGQTFVRNLHLKEVIISAARFSFGQGITNFMSKVGLHS